MSRHSPTKYWTGDLIWCNPELPQNIVIILTVIRFRKNVARGLSQFGDPTTIQMKQDQIELERSASFQCSMSCELCTVGKVA